MVLWGLRIAEEAEVGVEGSGFTVMLERALSVLEPVIELKREIGSCLVIVTGSPQRDVAGRNKGAVCAACCWCCWCCSSCCYPYCCYFCAQWAEAIPLSEGQPSSGHCPVVFFAVGKLC